MFDINYNKLRANNKAVDELKETKVTINPNAFYMGIVIDNVDSHMLGRIRVRIPALHGVNSSELNYLEDSQLPLARPAIFPSLANDSGQFLIPPIRC